MNPWPGCNEFWDVSLHFALMRDILDSRVCTLGALTSFTRRWVFRQVILEDTAL